MRSNHSRWRPDLAAALPGLTGLNHIILHLRCLRVFHRHKRKSSGHRICWRRSGRPRHSPE